MKYLNAVETRQTNRSPFSPQEIDEHEDAERIWAIIAEIKREAKDACQKSWDDGHWAGRHDKDEK